MALLSGSQSVHKFFYGFLIGLLFAPIVVIDGEQLLAPFSFLLLHFFSELYL